MIRRPSSVAEALLGALLVNPDAIKEVAPLVVPGDFPGARSREVYSAMLALYEDGVPIDFLLVEHELERRGTLAFVGRGDLVGLINAAPTSLHAVEYAKLVARDARGHTGGHGLAVRQSVTEALDL